MRDLQTATQFIEQDPWAILGFLCLGFSGLLFFRMRVKLGSIGESPRGYSLPLGYWFKVPRMYLKNAEAQGWPQFPAYAGWGCAPLGFILIVVGIARV